MNIRIKEIAIEAAKKAAKLAYAGVINKFAAKKTGYTITIFSRDTPKLIPGHMDRICQQVERDVGICQDPKEGTDDKGRFFSKLITPLLSPEALKNIESIRRSFPDSLKMEIAINTYRKITDNKADKIRLVLSSIDSVKGDGRAAGLLDAYAARVIRVINETDGQFEGPIAYKDKVVRKADGQYGEKHVGAADMLEPGEELVSRHVREIGIVPGNETLGALINMHLPDSIKSEFKAS